MHFSRSLAPTESQDAKHHKATEIAQRLLKEISEEQITGNDKGDDAEHEKEVNKISGILSLIDELYPTDDEFYAPEGGLDSKMAELDEILPILQQQLSKDSMEEQDGKWSIQSRTMIDRLCLVHSS